jgi:hypothetical protein
MASRPLSSLLVLASVLLAAPVWANERHFTYTYESAVLNPGNLEIEPWSTWRFGHERYFNRWDERLEFEYGIVENLQTSLYWNFEAVAEDVDVVDATGAVTGVERQRELAFASISSEWKYRLSDLVADPIGSALYFEGSLGPAEAEIEAKVILDKRIGPWLLAANLIGEHEWVFETADGTEREAELELALGGAYFLTDWFSAGIEARNVNELEGGSDFESSVIYAGPVLGFARENWWTALTVMPQIVALKGASDGRVRDVERQEKLQVRLLLGFHL